MPTLSFLTASEASKEYYPIFFTTDYAFEEFYSICIQLVNKTWKEMRATSGDFGRVMQVVKEQIVRALSDKQATLELFRVRDTEAYHFIIVIVRPI